MKVDLEWVTPQAEETLVRMARVSNPASAAAGEHNDRLIRYLIKHKHWSPFEMVHACFDIETTRDISRQIIRHRSFSFQEFSQRYAEPGGELTFQLRSARTQDPKNRQSSVRNDDGLLEDQWARQQETVLRTALNAYQWAIGKGIAKEVARNLLPEGMTPTRLYMVGSFRSWIHYLTVRQDSGTQFEHRVVAEAIYNQLVNIAPAVFIHGVHECLSSS